MLNVDHCMGTIQFFCEMIKIVIGQMEISGKQLQDYEQLCTEQDAQLKHLRENTIPELEGRLAELEGR